MEGYLREMEDVNPNQVGVTMTMLGKVAILFAKSCWTSISLLLVSSLIPCSRVPRSLMRKTCPQCTIDVTWLYPYNEHKIFAESYVVTAVKDNYGSSDSRRQVMQMGLIKYIK